ncbi:MAG: Gfo/Idh/MocA family oxidoreductase [Nanoarchaeota archaeon]|nr:Gfo/Idh/MocA family oxidoreductase [Nanoarchaeota archaeon]
MRFLIIGLGSIGIRHAKNLAKIVPDSEIYSLRQRNLPLKGLDGVKIKTFTDAEKAFSHGYDAVFITNPTSMHMEYCLKAAEKGFNLFIEKPMTHKINGIEKLRQVVKKKKLVAFVGYNMRFHPGIKKMKEMIESGKLGKLYMARAQVGEYLPDWHPEEDYSKGYSARKEMGGGPLLSLIHEIDYMIWMKGIPSKVCAMMGKVSNLKVSTEDNVEILMRYDDGFIAEINMNIIMQDHKRTCQIVGEKGEIELDYHSKKLWFFENLSKKKKLFWDGSSWDRNDMYVEEMKSFIEALKKGKSPIDLDEGLKSLNIAFAVQESGEKERFVDIGGASWTKKD